VNEGKRSLTRSKRRREHDIRNDLREIGWRGVGWMHMAQDRDQVAYYCEHSNELSVSIKGGKFLDKMSEC